MFTHLLLSIFEFSITEVNDPSDEANFGYCNGNEKILQRGWLTNETVVQLKLFGANALNIWKKKYKSREFFIKVTPVRANKSNLEDAVPSSFSDDSQSMDMNSTRDKWQSWPIVEVAVSLVVFIISVKSLLHNRSALTIFCSWFSNSKIFAMAILAKLFRYTPQSCTN